MRAAPFPYALVLAIAAHAAGAFAFVSAVRPPRSSPVEESFPIEVVDAPPPPAPSIPPELPHAYAAEAPQAAVAAALAPRVPSEPATASSADPPAGSVTPDLPRPASSTEAWSLGPSRPTDLGVGSYWRTVAAAEPPQGPSASDAPNGRAPSAVEMIKRELAAEDHELGLGPASPLVAAAHEAASPSIAPDVGSAIFEIEADENGRIVSARLVSEGADRAAWTDVGRAIMSAMAPDAKRLHLPHGSRGLRARLQITADRVLPSGEHHTYTAGAVPDDVAGGGSACVPNGTTRKCLSGSPVGASGTLGDLSNIGQKRSRVVHVQLLGEETF